MACANSRRPKPTRKTRRTETASKHTPTPWFVEMPLEMEMDSMPVIMGGAKGTEPVCEILGPLTDEDGPHRGHYDAALICAAPALLAACRSALKSLGCCDEHDLAYESDL